MSRTPLVGYTADPAARKRIPLPHAPMLTSEPR